MALVFPLDDPVLTFNVSTVSPSLTSLFSIRANDLGLSNGVINTFGLNSYTSVNPTGFVIITANHPTGRFQFTYTVTDPNMVESDPATVTYFVVNMMATPDSQIPPIPNLIPGEESLLLPGIIIGNTLNSITSDIPSVQDDLVIEIWTASNPGVHLLRTAHQYLQETSLNPLAWDYYFTPLTDGPDTLYVQYGYSAFSFQVSRSFNARSVNYAGVWLNDQSVTVVNTVQTDMPTSNNNNAAIVIILAVAVILLLMFLL